MGTPPTRVYLIDKPVCLCRRTTTAFIVIPEHAAQSTLSIKNVFDLLAKSHRRIVLAYLQDADGATATLTELAAVVQDRVDDVESEQHARISLVHQHLPRLADHGVIDYDQRSETVRYRDSTRLETILETVPTDDSTV
jgi:predicted transcriptional regulator